MDLSTLAPAGIGAAATLIVTVVTSLVSSRREERLWQRESHRRQEERAEREATRTHDQRLQAYLDFVSTLSTQEDAWFEWAESHGNWPAPEDAMADLMRAKEKVVLFGSRDAAQCGDSVVNLISDRWQGKSYDFDPIHQAWDAFIEQARKDLGVPDSLSGFSPQRRQ